MRPSRLEKPAWPVLTGRRLVSSVVPGFLKGLFILLLTCSQEYDSLTSVLLILLVPKPALGCFSSQSGHEAGLTKGDRPMGASSAAGSCSSPVRWIFSSFLCTNSGALKALLLHDCCTRCIIILRSNNTRCIQIAKSVMRCLKIQNSNVITIPRRPPRPRSESHSQQMQRRRTCILSLTR